MIHVAATSEDPNQTSATNASQNWRPWQYCVSPRHRRAGLYACLGARISALLEPSSDRWRGWPQPRCGDLHRHQ